MAQEAARIMAEHGVHDFLTAKRKAAERYGNPDDAAWPRNTEIEAALIEYQRLFAADTHGSRLQRQRSAALAAMRRLTRFEPRLVGPVLNGTATSHSDVQLHLFTDQPEIVGLELLDRGVEHEVIEPPSRACALKSMAKPSRRPFSRSMAYARRRSARSTDARCAAPTPRNWKYWFHRRIPAAERRSCRASAAGGQARFATSM